MGPWAGWGLRLADLSNQQFGVFNRSQRSFQMTVEINYAIAIAKLSDWFKNLAPAFLASSKLQVIARNSDRHWHFKKPL